MMKRHGDLSSAQRRIVLRLAQWEHEERPAFVPDLVQALGLAAESSITPTLRILQRDAFLDIGGGGIKGRSRILRLTAKGRLAAGVGGLPLVGSIAAGPLSEALAEPEQIYDARDLLPHRVGDFLLRVRGDSMTGDGILDGDKVLLRPGIDAADGEIAAVLVGDDHEATLKRIYREGAKLRLKAGNPRYADLLVDAATVKIAGVFRGLIRHGSSR